jgi:hypothetical protein
VDIEKVQRKMKLRKNVKKADENGLDRAIDG